MPLTEEPAAGTGSDADVHDDPPTSLVEIKPGIAIVLGEGIPLEFVIDFIPLAMLGERTRQDLTDKLATVPGLGNVMVQGARAAADVRGLVRLSPQTLQALETAQPMASEGWNLGSLASSNGRITASVRWAPAAGVQGAAVLAALGPAAALLALQIQFSSFSRRLEEGNELTREVLEFLQQDHRDRIESLYETMRNAIEEAEAVGSITDHVFAPVRSIASRITEERKHFGRRVDQHVEKLRDAKKRRTHVQESGDAILADVRAMLIAEDAWFCYQALRSAHIDCDEGLPPGKKEKHIGKILDEVRVERPRVLERIDGVLGKLELQCRLIAELPSNSISQRIPWRQADFKDPATRAERLAEAIAELHYRTRPAPSNPAVTVFEDGALDKALKIIRLILPRDASLLALAEVALNRRRPSGVLGVTSESFFLTEHDKLRKQGEIEINRPLSDIRYVRFHQPDDGDSEGGPVLEIITRDENFRVTFRPWAGEGENLEGARRLGDMLATAMNLPEEERRADPLILEAGSRAPRPAVERPRD